MDRRIVIMAGGTGGHVFPALAVAKLLREQGWAVTWMGTRKGLESRVAPQNGFEIDWLTIAGLRGKGWGAKFKAPLLLLGSCLQSWKILRRRRPDVVLGMGGFASGPGGLVAKLMGLPLVIHEQNRIPGTTNRWLSKVADRVLEAFPESFAEKAKAVCTGNPLRKEIAALQTGGGRSGGSREKMHLLVIGGSLGARILNEIVPEAGALLEHVAIRHQTGEAMREEVEAEYRKLGLDAEAAAFIEDMAEAYRWADLVVCRSGAMTVSEIAAAGLPGILIPYPYAIDDHQTANARYLADAGGAVVIDQKSLTAKRLAEEIECILKSENGLKEMSRAAERCARLDATEAVAECCKQEAER
ncbi:MAG: undecaprenyldiphospho-muramoylpentapeptide beta-N-acetylglucosaminyltransferase [Gammaproteobacteria bacterium]